MQKFIDTKAFAFMMKLHAYLVQQGKIADGLDLSEIEAAKDAALAETQTVEGLVTAAGEAVTEITDATAPKWDDEAAKLINDIIKEVFFNPEASLFQRIDKAFELISQWKKVKNAMKDDNEDGA